MINYSCIFINPMSQIYKNVFMMSDQPTTCPYCGNRTEIISDLFHTNLKAQVNKCYSIKCKSLFVEVEDVEFLNER